MKVSIQQWTGSQSVRFPQMFKVLTVLWWHPPVSQLWLKENLPTAWCSHRRVLDNLQVSLPTKRFAVRLKYSVLVSTVNISLLSCFFDYCSDLQGLNKTKTQDNQKKLPIIYIFGFFSSYSKNGYLLFIPWGCFQISLRGVLLFIFYIRIFKHLIWNKH